jgi:hypothetical protein
VRRWRYNRATLPEVAPDPTFVLSHAIAAAVVRDTDDRPAMLRAAAAIANGNERAASRFGYCMASAIIDELRNGMQKGIEWRHRIAMRHAAKRQARATITACATLTRLRAKELGREVLVTRKRLEEVPRPL